MAELWGGRTMHRVFRKAAPRRAPGDDDGGLRALLRSLGLVEEATTGAFVYWCPHPGGRFRQFATLHVRGRGATVYLYPDALGREPGFATRFYLLLDEAGLGMGSKAGPSIGIDLDDPAQVRAFAEGLRTLFPPDRPNE